jgi:hypothetical protein
MAGDLSDTTHIVDSNSGHEPALIVDAWARIGIDGSGMA